MTKKALPCQWFLSSFSAHRGKVMIVRLSALFSVLREEVFEIGRGQVFGKALFAQDIADGLGFSLLEFPDLFFHRAGRDQTIGVHRLGLADSMGSIDRLGLNRRVPPRIVEHDVTGGGQIKTRSSCPQTQKEDGGLGIVLEGVDDLHAVLGLTSE